jgi:hypothetical protein
MQEEEYVTYLVSKFVVESTLVSEANLCGDCVLQCLLSRSVFVRDGACCLSRAKNGKASFAETNLRQQVDANSDLQASNVSDRRDLKSESA